MGELRRFNVDTRRILRGPGRMGIYFLEAGANQLPSKVIYDRADSSIALAGPGTIDWNVAFEGIDWFHITGITPAISQSLMELSLESVKEAKARGIKVSCDLNYRKNLWTTEEAGRVMDGLMKLVDVCIANEEDADKVFGIRAENTDVDSGKLDHEAYKSVARQLSERFGFKKVAITLRTSISANDNIWAAMLYDAPTNQYCFSKSYNLHIVDRVGGGDSFGGGLIYATLDGRDPQGVIEFATAASALKHSVEGDFNHVSADEVDSLIKSGGSGRVQR